MKCASAITNEMDRILFIVQIHTISLPVLWRIKIHEKTHDNWVAINSVVDDAQMRKKAIS